MQGTINGYGERTGNADLVTVVANLELKAGRAVLPAGRARRGDPDRSRDQRDHQRSRRTTRQPYVGASAFAHKAGLHASAIKVDPDLYQHVDPPAVGNDMRMLVSDMAGRASIELKGRELGFDLSGDRELLTRITDRVKALEARGYTFEAADASFELLLREEVDGARPAFFDVESWRVITESRAGRRRHLRGDGQAARPTVSATSRPARATARSTRSTTPCARRCCRSYPELEKLELIDYKVRILDASHGTDAVTRVLIETTDGDDVLGHGRRRRRTSSRRPGRRCRRAHLRAAPPGGVSPTALGTASAAARPAHSAGS